MSHIILLFSHPFRILILFSKFCRSNHILLIILLDLCAALIIHYHSGHWNLCFSLNPGIPRTLRLKSALRWPNRAQVPLHSQALENVKHCLQGHVGNIFYGEATFFIPTGLDKKPGRGQNTCISTRTPAYTMNATLLAQPQSVSQEQKKMQTAKKISQSDHSAGSRTLTLAVISPAPQIYCCRALQCLLFL